MVSDVKFLQFFSLSFIIYCSYQIIFVITPSEQANNKEHFDKVLLNIKYSLSSKKIIIFGVGRKLLRVIVVTSPVGYLC